MPRGTNSNDGAEMNRAQRRQQATEQRQETAQSLGTDPGEVSVQQLRNQNNVALSSEGERDVRQTQTSDSEFIRPDDLDINDRGPGIEIGVAESARQDIASRVQQDVAGQSRFARRGDVEVDVTDAGIEDVNVNQSAIRSRQRQFQRQQARQEAARKLSDEIGSDIDASDIEISDGQAQLNDTAAEQLRDQQRSELRSEAAEEFDVDPSQVDIAQQNGKLVAEADVQRDVPSDIARINPGPVGSVDAEIEETLSDTPTANVESSSSPGAVATVTGAVANTLANNPVGDAIGNGADALFGTDSAGGGAIGEIEASLDRRAQSIDASVADEIRQSEPAQTEAVAPGVGGASAAANSDFIRNTAATATELVNPAAFARDTLRVGSAGAQVADFIADEGPEGAQAVLDAGSAAARAAPGAAVDVAQQVRENPQQAAEVGTALVATGVAGGAVSRGARGTASAARRLTSRLDADLDDFRQANRAQGQLGSQRSRDTVDLSDAQSGRDFEADLRQQELSQDQAILRDQATRERNVRRDLVDDPQDVDPIGSGGRGPTFDPDRPSPAGPSRPTARTENVGQNVPQEFTGLQRADNVPTTDLRTVVDAGTSGTSGASGALSGSAAATGAASRAPSQLVDADGSVVEPASGLDITTPRPASTGTSTASTTVEDIAAGTQTATATDTATASTEAFLNQGVETGATSRGSVVPTGAGVGTRPSVRTGLRTGQRAGVRSDTALRQGSASTAPPASRASPASSTGATTSASERVSRAIRGTSGGTTPRRPNVPESNSGDKLEDDRSLSSLLEETFDNPIASVEEVRSEVNDQFSQ